MDASSGTSYGLPEGKVQLDGFLLLELEKGLEHEVFEREERVSDRQVTHRKGTLLFCLKEKRQQ